MDVLETLRQHAIRPSSQRVAIASYILTATNHPSAEQVWEHARRSARVLSRATVYSTLSLFAQKKLIRAFVVDGRTVFDPNVDRHHHLVDEGGRIHDVPWMTLRAAEAGSVGSWDVEEYHVVLRGRRKRATRGVPPRASASARKRRARSEREREATDRDE